jgi:hypothetical protein
VAYAFGQSVANAGPSVVNGDLSRAVSNIYNAPAGSVTNAIKQDAGAAAHQFAENAKTPGGFGDNVGGAAATFLVPAIKIDVPASPKPDASPAPGAKPADANAPPPPANSPPPGGCFIAGTLVSTPYGDVPIEKIRAGELVWSLDLKSGHVVKKKVESLFSHVTEYWVNISAGGQKITATRGHRFWVESLKQWVPAENLKTGMKLLASSGRIISVTQVHVRHLPVDEKTYNFFVADTHVYFVGQQHWLAHNGDDYPVKPQYPPPTKVGENFQFNFDTSKNYKNSRQAGVERAKAAGTVQDGEIGDHINSVQSHPHLAPEPSNIQPSSDFNDHFNNKHGGDFTEPKSGPLNPKC